jgi:hypothetical protein
MKRFSNEQEMVDAYAGICIDKLLDVAIQKSRIGAKDFTIRTSEFMSEIFKDFGMHSGHLDPFLDKLESLGLSINRESPFPAIEVTDKFFQVALSRRYPNLKGELADECLAVLKAAGYTKHAFAYIQGYNEFIGAVARSFPSVSVIGLNDKLDNKLAVESLKSVDNNLFKTCMTMISSVYNFDHGRVEKIGFNDKPLETLRTCLSFILSDDTKVFHCSDAVADMLMMTNNKIYKRNLPFVSIYVDVNFKYRNHTYFGMFLSSVEDHDEKIHFCDDCGDKSDGFHVIAMGIDEKDATVVYNFTAILRDGIFKPEKNDRFGKFLATFACNFLDFLHDPNVRFMKASESSGHSHKILRARYERLKIDLDKTYFIKIEDPLRRYVDNFVRMRTMHGYAYRFWVRGHFRTLHADRYGEHIGKRLWIAPFIKGQGMLVEKQYAVDKREDCPS